MNRLLRAWLLLVPFLCVLAVGCGGDPTKTVVPTETPAPIKGKPQGAPALS